tara:strand:- start:613 stop:2019 length:1407 start_codon:yes stop_codon:yes gene_type:complete
MTWLLFCVCLSASAIAQCTLMYQVPGFTPTQPIVTMERRPMGQLLVLGEGDFAERNANGWVPLTQAFWFPGDLGAAPNGDVYVTGSHLTTELVCTYHPYFGTTCTSQWIIYGLGVHAANGSWTYDHTTASGGWVEAMTDGTIVYYAGGWHAQPPAPGLSSLADIPRRAAAHPEGGLVVLTNLELHRWANGSWSTLGAADFDGLPRMLSVTTGGEVVAAGGFTSVNANPIGSIARFDGTSWHSLGATNGGEINDIAELPNGDLVAAGSFSSIGGVAANHIARWDSSTWSAIGSGTDGTINALAWADGSLWLGGDFTTADGLPSPNLARITSSCPATAVMTGVGCAGTNGVDMVEPMEFPWFNGVYLSHASSLPTTAIAVSVYGLTQTSLPLSIALPQALPGCDLQVVPVVTQIGLVVDGTFDDELQIGGSTMFVGQSLFHQVIAVGFDANGQIQEITSSNVLALTIGDF